MFTRFTISRLFSTQLLPQFVFQLHARAHMGLGARLVSLNLPKFDTSYPQLLPPSPLQLGGSLWQVAAVIVATVRIAAE